jgi:hypothetical protein
MWGRASDRKHSQTKNDASYGVLLLILNTSRAYSEMGGSCSTHGRDEMYTELQSENLKGRNHSQDLGLDGRII